MSAAARASNADEAKRPLERDGICHVEGMLDSPGFERVRSALRRGL